MEYAPPEYTQPAPAAGPTRDFLDRFASEPFARQLTQSMPNLCYLLLDLSNATGLRSDPMEYWSVERTQNEGFPVMTRRIGRSEGELIMSKGFTVWNPSFSHFN